jgi:hypothetical protein
MKKNVWIVKLEGRLGIGSIPKVNDIFPDSKRL